MLLGATLGSRPDVVVEQLRKTPHGCEWLMARWAMLAHSADVNQKWTPAQDRAGVRPPGHPGEFREGHRPGASLDFRGRVIEAADDPAAVARREIDLLLERRELVDVLDEASRALAEADLARGQRPRARRLRRYESTLHGRLRWCLGQLRYPVAAGGTLSRLEDVVAGQERATDRGRGPGAAGPLPLPEPKPSPSRKAGSSRSTRRSTWSSRGPRRRRALRRPDDPGRSSQGRDREGRHQPQRPTSEAGKAESLIRLECGCLLPL